MYRILVGVAVRVAVQTPEAEAESAEEVIGLGWMTGSEVSTRWHFPGDSNVGL
jgi:hypothetical protein